MERAVSMNTPHEIPEWKLQAAKRAIVKTMAQRIFATVNPHTIQVAMEVIVKKQYAVHEAKQELDFALSDCATEMLKK